LQSYHYDFDAAGNLTNVEDHCDEGQLGTCQSSGYFTASYGYDSLHQLTSMTTGDGAHGFGYDAAGNLTNHDGVPQAYGGPQPHAPSSAGGESFTYDPNGNLISGTGGLTLAWNAENMPISMQAGGTTTTKSFVGESIWKKVEGADVTYYLPSMRLENGAPRKYYGDFAERDTDGSLKFHHNDHLSSSVLVTDAGGNVIHRAAYYPYGADFASVGWVPKLQFTFQEKEANGYGKGLYDFGARMYNPATGRFLSPDTDTADGLNHYAYVRNDPIRLFDPSGHQIQVPDTMTSSGPLGLTLQITHREDTPPGHGFLRELGLFATSFVTGPVKWAANSVNAPIDAVLATVGTRFRFGSLPVNDYERGVGWGLDAYSFYYGAATVASSWQEARYAKAAMESVERWPGIIEIGDDYVEHLPSGITGVRGSFLPGVKMSTLDVGDLVEVETKSASYVIEVLDPGRASIRILGGEFPMATPATLRRSIFVRGMKMRSTEPAIVRGARMVVRPDELGGRAITGKVVKVGRFGKYSGNE
jgi:RHS repeat-associated protein